MVLIAQSENTETLQRRKLIVAGQIAFLPTGVLNTLLWPMLPILAARWALNDRQAGSLFLIQFLSQLVGVQGSGAILARVGFRPAFLAGLLLMAGGVGTLYLGTAWLGFVSVAVYGLGLGLLIPTANLMVAEISSASRAAAVSLLNFFWGVGAVCGSLLVGWAQAHHLVPALLGSLSIFLVLLALSVRNLAYPSAAKKSDSPISWVVMLKTPIIWLFAIVFFFYPGTEAAVGGWIGSYATRMGMLKATAALMPALFLTALTLGRGAGGVLLRAVSEQWVLRVGYGLGAAGIGLLLRTSAVPAVIASAMIIGFGFALLYPIAVARLSHRFGVQARSVGAVMFSIAAVGPAILPWLVGVVSQSTGSLRIGLAVPLVSTVILLLVHVKKW
jgi:FHS family glucose/mannose:H+ symporter-like MFS transporter